MVLFRLHLNEAIEAIEQGQRERKIINAILIKTLRKVNEIRIDYARAVNANDFSEPEIFQTGERVVSLIAVFLGKTRLIDNALVTV